MGLVSNRRNEMKLFPLAVLVVTVLLAACGGGGDGAGPALVATASPPEADVTLVQDQSFLNVTPGETVRVTSLALLCKHRLP